MVHVWLVIGFPPAPEDSLLDDDERARADRFVFERDRRRFVVAHAVLRRVLAGYLGRPATSLRFATQARGKPELIDSGGLAFNLSHSGEGVAVAVARGGRLGVDIECRRPKSDRDGMVARFFSPAEKAAFFALAEAAREDAFYRLWTRKEAWIKALGEGLWRSLDSFSVGLDVPARMVDPADGWSLYHFVPAPGYLGAVALDRQDALIAPRFLTLDG